MGRAECLLVVLATAMLAACGSAGRGAKVTGGRDASTAEGSVLLARVQAAYRNVVAVRLRGSAPDPYRFTVYLRHGAITAEQQLASFPPSYHQAQQLHVGYPDGRGFSFQPPPACWVPEPNFWRVAGGSGARLPDVVVSQAETARRIRDIWLLPVLIRGSKATLRIDAKTLSVREMTYEHHGGKEYFRNLTQAPTLPTPRPLCRK